MNANVWKALGQMLLDGTPCEVRTEAGEWKRTLLTDFDSLRETVSVLDPGKMHYDPERGYFTPVFPYGSLTLVLHGREITTRLRRLHEG